jgi:hypothetical protein
MEYCQRATDRYLSDGISQIFGSWWQRRNVKVSVLFGMYRLISGPRPSSTETSAASMRKPKTRLECQDTSHRPNMQINFGFRKGMTDGGSDTALAPRSAMVFATPWFLSHYSVTFITIIQGPAEIPDDLVTQLWAEPLAWGICLCAPF